MILLQIPLEMNVMMCSKPKEAGCDVCVLSVVVTGTIFFSVLFVWSAKCKIQF